MKRVTTFILMSLLMLSGSFCNAEGAVRTRNEKGEDTPIEILKRGTNNGIDRGNAISCTINGHLLIVVLCENLGQVSIEITTATGALVNCSSVLTPNGQQFYIPNAGNYIVTFTLSNGDEYYGEFTVEN